MGLTTQSAMNFGLNSTDDRNIKVCYLNVGEIMKNAALSKINLETLPSAVVQYYNFGNYLNRWQRIFNYFCNESTYLCVSALLKE